VQCLSPFRDAYASHVDTLVLSRLGHVSAEADGTYVVSCRGGAHVLFAPSEDGEGWELSAVGPDGRSGSASVDASCLTGAVVSIAVALVSALSSVRSARTAQSTELAPIVEVAS
jgi:hypothetical protein